MRHTVLIVAAGAGSRLGAGMPKALVPLADGQPILEHCLEGVLAAHTGARAQRLAGIVVVLPADPAQAAPLQTLCTRWSARSLDSEGDVKLRTVSGGAERADSVRAGLQACTALGGESVLVHDAARPFVPAEVFARVEDALEAGLVAVVPAVAVTDTVAEVVEATDGAEATAPVGDAGPLESRPERMGRILTRARLRAVQTPQGFRLQDLLAAHALAQGRPGVELTDDSMVMRAAGHEVGIVEGAEASLKITTAPDLERIARLGDHARPGLQEETP